ncbi:hypothetical protein E1B28_012986 [Marasmius oreades]|uniref:Uncharacterized protein n=1 Tax=Marasmius oreades TaxID=181124 RepID=A0A9P7RPC9_9AGAR|nr:uncharacterized protein E1B28_012986 [Marasmius oreades]KAG7087007.1 hypothetical protein E1B28_012986 [Marasmius oreades]
MFLLPFNEYLSVYTKSARKQKVHTDLVSVTNNVDVTTTDLSVCRSIPASDFPGLVDGFRAVVEALKEVCQDFVSKKAVFGAFPNAVTQLKEDLRDLAASLVALEQAIVGLAPDNLKSQVQDLSDEANAAIAAAQAAF